MSATPGAADSAGKGTEAPHNKAGVPEAEAAVDLQGKYDPRFSTLKWKEKWASQGQCGGSKVVTMQGSFFLDLCIQIQQAISHT